MKAATHRKLAPGTKRKRLCAVAHELVFCGRSEMKIYCRRASPARASVCICFICRLLDLLAGKATHAHTSSLDVDASKQHTEHLQQRILARTKCCSCLDSPSDAQTTGFLITRRCVSYFFAPIRHRHTI
jgi:hypothetical protein